MIASYYDPNDGGVRCDECGSTALLVINMADIEVPGGVDICMACLANAMTACFNGAPLDLQIKMRDAIFHGVEVALSRQCLPPVGGGKST